MGRLAKKPVDEPPVPAPEDVDVIEIDADEFERARRDPRLIVFAEEADRLARDLPHPSEA